MYGAGQFARGRGTVEAAVMATGLTVVDQDVVETMYQVNEGKIVRF